MHLLIQYMLKVYTRFRFNSFVYTTTHGKGEHMYLFHFVCLTIHNTSIKLLNHKNLVNIDLQVQFGNDYKYARLWCYAIQLIIHVHVIVNVHMSSNFNKRRPC